MEIVIPFLMTFIVGELQLVAENKKPEVDMAVIGVSATLMIVCAVIALVAGAALACRRRGAYTAFRSEWEAMLPQYRGKTDDFA